MAKNRKKRRKLRKEVKMFLYGLLVVCLGLTLIKFTTKSNNESDKQADKTTEKQEDVETIATIMIDPGHGGYDGGSIGSDDTAEKDLTLSIAKKVGSQLEKMNPGIKVVYTRTTDNVSWPEDESEDLKARVKMANDQDIDYYLSIHINSNLESSVYGFCSYVREDDKVSQAIAEAMAENLEEAEWSYDNGILSTYDYPLYVVDHTKAPAILFEAGYISNDEELAAMKKNKNQTKIAKAIAKAYSDYINQNNKTEN